MLFHVKNGKEMFGINPQTRQTKPVKIGLAGLVSKINSIDLFEKIIKPWLPFWSEF